MLAFSVKSSGQAPDRSMAKSKRRGTPEPLVLYSTGTWLAFKIAEMFYGDHHFVWCTPCFNPTSVHGRGASVPPTSCPSTIYHSLFEEVQAGDRHSAKIKENKLGIVNGATQKKKSRVISDKQYLQIVEIMEAAAIQDFRPVIYVIPFAGVRRLVREVPVRKRAHPLAAEYIIEELPGNCFDLIELRRS
jgi:hypothetical protein